MFNKNKNDLEFIMMTITTITLCCIIFLLCIIKNVYAESYDFSDESPISDTYDNEYNSDTEDELVIQEIKRTAVKNNIALASASSNMPKGYESFLTSLLHIYGMPYGFVGETYTDAVDSLIQNMKDNGEIDSNGNITTSFVSNEETFSGSGGHYLAKDDDGNLHISASFYNELNGKIEDVVKELNGYYLFTGDNLKNGYNNYLKSYYNYSTFLNIYQQAYNEYLENKNNYCSDWGNDLVYLKSSSKSNICFVFNCAKYGYILRSNLYDACTKNKFCTFEINCYIDDDLNLSFSTVYYNYFNFRYANSSFSDVTNNGRAINSVKFFYSEPDYNAYVLNLNSGENLHIYFAPTYNPGNTVVNKNVINYINENPNSEVITQYINNSKTNVCNNYNEDSQEYTDELWKLLWKMDDILAEINNQGGW